MLLKRKGKSRIRDSGFRKNKTKAHMLKAGAILGFIFWI
jgi:hypothetical protein